MPRFSGAAWGFGICGIETHFSDFSEGSQVDVVLLKCWKTVYNGQGGVSGLINSCLEGGLVKDTLLPSYRNIPFMNLSYNSYT